MKWTKEHTAQVLELYLRERLRQLNKRDFIVQETASKQGRNLCLPIHAQSCRGMANPLGQTKLKMIHSAGR